MKFLGDRKYDWKLIAGNGFSTRDIYECSDLVYYYTVSI